MHMRQEIVELGDLPDKGRGALAQLVWDIGKFARRQDRVKVLQSLMLQVEEGSFALEEDSCSCGLMLLNWLWVDQEMTACLSLMVR